MKFFILFWLFAPAPLCIQAQTYYVPNGWIWRIQLQGVCNPCTQDSIGFIDNRADGGASFGPDGLLYTLSGGAFYGVSIFQVDVMNANATLLFQGPPNTPEMYGFVAAGGGIFYSTPEPTGFIGTDELYKWDINAGTVTMIGHIGYPIFGEMCVSNGNLYTLSWTMGETERKIIQVDPINPANSQVITSFAYNVGIYGLSASPISNTLIGTQVWPGGPDIILISLIDGTYSTICEFSGYFGAVTTITSPLEWGTDPMTDPFLDLDCDNSSGALNSDYNGSPFTCLSEDGVAIADNDIIIQIDAPIDNLTAKLVNPIPDGAFEALFISGAPPGIAVSGSGTPLITLTNTGNAKISDFTAALGLINYFNSALSPTGGQRTVEVQFTTSIGSMSNVAKAYIEVTELPQLTVDLGPDLDLCEGESAQLDAGHPGADFQWSTGATDQTINVFEPGLYSVTVSNGIQCPNSDEIQVNVLPIVQVSLLGDDVVCQGEAATLILVSDAPFPLTITVSSSTGGSFFFEDVQDTLGFIDYPYSITEYLIANITASQPACLVSDDNFQVIEILPDYAGSDSVQLCQGDSILLGNQWISVPGQYPIPYPSITGCDSIITYTVSLLPAIHLYLLDSTCDPMQSGLFYSYLPNPNGCDTVVETKVILLATDTLNLMKNTCNSDSTGVFAQHLFNQAGCDSIILTQVTLTPPPDTTFLFQYTCDTSAIGTFSETLTNHAGCDSLVVTAVEFSGLDTTFLYTTSCDSSDLGNFIQNLLTDSGCDSTVLTAVTYSENDSTWLAETTCDSLAAGIFIRHLINRHGCDSIVMETISLQPVDVVWIHSTTCNPAESGNFSDTLSNQFGCDSIVNASIELLPSDTLLVSTHTCQESEEGIFSEHYTNQFGCDSLVILSVIYESPDTTVLNSFTCNPDEVGTEWITMANQYGCDSLVMSQVNLYPPSILQLEITSGFNGYAIRCKDGMDGSILAHAEGEPPYLYLWSDGSTDVSIDSLTAGSYFITLTDGFGCRTTAGINLDEPLPLSMSLILNEPSCFDHQEGSVTIIAAGGVLPYRYSLNGGPVQSTNVFDRLTKGTYQVTVFDANDCVDQEMIWINVPLQVNVDLGEDEIIDIGDTTYLQILVDIPYDSLSNIVWSGLNPNPCPNCIQQPVSPIITSAYSVTVTTIDGCTDSDEITITVHKDFSLYVPNVFSPNGDQINDRFWIGAGSGITEIRSLVIFDRWGNMVFRGEHLHPNDPGSGWDGKLNGKDLPPAVYAYGVTALTREGSQLSQYGDLTLIR